MIRRITTELPAPREEKTNVSKKGVIGDKEIFVDDPTVFSGHVDEPVLVGKRGRDTNVVNYIDSVNSDSVTLKEGLLYDLEKEEELTLLEYDEFELLRDDDGTSTSVHKEDLFYGNPRGLIEAVDRTAKVSPTKEYTLKVRNTVTNTEETLVENDVLETVGFLNVELAASEIGLSSPTTELVDALQYGFSYVRNQVFSEKTFSSNERANKFNIDLEKRRVIVDLDGDFDISSNDVIVYVKSDNGENMRYVTHLVQRVIAERDSKIYFKEIIPEQNETLYMEVQTGDREFKKKRSLLQQVQKLISANHILRNANNENMKEGISSWSAGGKSVTRDASGTQSLVQSNKDRANEILNNNISRYYSKTTPLRTRRNHLSNRIPQQRRIGRTSRSIGVLREIR